MGPLILTFIMWNSLQIFTFFFNYTFIYTSLTGYLCNLIYGGFNPSAMMELCPTTTRNKSVNVCYDKPHGGETLLWQVCSVTNPIQENQIR